MNAEEKGKITQNLTYLKERLGELDRIIDRLIEKDAFRLEHRAQIEGISKPTPHRQFNEFIKLLVSSPSKYAYEVFVEALREEGYDHIVQKLQRTSVKENHGRYQSAGSGRSAGRPLNVAHYRVENASPDDHASAASAAPSEAKSGCTDCADTIKSFLDTFAKQQQTLIANIENQRREDMLSYERRRSEDQNQSKEQMNQLWRQWNVEKQEMIRENENKIANLQSQINDFKRGSVEFNFLKEKYDHLKEKQKLMREKDDERRTRLLQMTQEREALKKENRKLEAELEKVQNDLVNSKEMNQNLEEDQTRHEEYSEELHTKICELEKELTKKEQDNKELKNKVQQQYSEIEELMRKQRDAHKTEDKDYARTVEQQNQKLDDIYGMMQTISNEKTQTHQQHKSDWKSKRTQGVFQAGANIGQRINLNKKN